jgi:outer membrane protein assembly factor BamD (BamD/ComL family)
MQSSGTVDALAFADRSIKLAPSIAEKAESTMLRASILFDRKQYRDAESLLAGIADGTATNGLTPSAARAQFTLGEISARSGKNDEAESRWLSLATRFPKDPLAEDAVYRAGELRYLEGNWARASVLFEQYRKTWPAGSQIDTVLRSGGDSYRKAGKIDLAILWWEDLAKKYPDASAVPRTLVDLVDAYREKTEYAAAIRVAELYRSKYPDEAKADGVERTLAELAALKNGSALATDARVDTAEGRVAALALAKRYLADYSRRADGKNVLSEITAKTPKSVNDVPREERSVFASAWSLLGSANREDGDFKTASRALLSAGTLWAPIDGERSAEALYGAVDCFLQAGLKADAVKTAETLATTWPLSVWTKRAQLLMER